MMTITTTKYKIKIDNYKYSLIDIKEHHIELIKIGNI